MGAPPEVIEAARSCMSLVMADGLWRTVGFRKRPRHGSLFQRLRPHWRVAFEKAVLKELLILLTAQRLAGAQLSATDLDAVLTIYVDGTGEPLWPVLGYPSREHGLQHLKGSIAEYLAAPLSDWPQRAIQRLAVDTVPDPQLRARLLVGFIAMVRNLTALVVEWRSGATAG